MQDKAKKLGWHVLVNKVLDFHKCRQDMRGFYSRSRAVNDSEMQDHVHTLPKIADMIYNHDIIETFENQFTDWIQNNSINKCNGLKNFQPDISQGATQTFDSFYIRHKDRKLKLFAGEYLYHIVVGNNLNIDWSFISSHDQLTSDDCLVLSVPFCDTGDQPNDLEQILEVCDNKNIPVLLDCAYYTISQGIDIDLNHSCIDTVAFSLSKTFPIAHARVGMRYTKPNISDGQKLHSKINYDNRISAGVGLHFINKFTSDYVYLKHQSFYKEIVDFLSLTPSQTIIFADGNEDWQQYGRRDILGAYGLEQDQSMYKNRVCITELLENKTITRNIMNEYH